MMQHWLLLLLSICHVVTKVIAFTKRQCDSEEPVRGILDLKQPSKPAQLINATSTDSLADCSLLCCNVKKCNTYIWRNNEQCFLFHCKAKEKCKILPYAHTMTGFVNKDQSSLADNNQKTPEMEHRKIYDHKQAGESFQVHKGESDATTAKQVTEKTSNDAHEDSTIAKKEDSVPLDNSVKREKGQNKTGHASSSKINTKPLDQKKMKGRILKASKQDKPVPVLNSSTLPQKVSHTTTTSLIAALVFGVIFLVAVAVQIGRPWWESVFTHKDGYNRITFLMNGK